MAQETRTAFYEQHRLIPQEREVTTHSFHLGQEIARQLNDGSQLLFDVDGVLLEADSLEQPTPTSLTLIGNIRELESLGYPVGLATARASHSLDYFRQEHGLNLQGFSILEEGQHRIINGESEYLTSEGVRDFMREAHYYMQLMPEFVPTWEEVQWAHASSRFAFTHGNQQWQGDVRRSFWFRSECDKEADDMVLLHYFDRILETIAAECNLDYHKDLAVTVSHMKSGNNLGMIGMKGKLDGVPVNKATALHGVSGNFLFVADGMGDLPLGYVLKRRKNMVIGVEGNLDDSREPCTFIKSADGVVKNPQELAAALTVAVAHLR